jgi:hypothetical protein
MTLYNHNVVKVGRMKLLSIRMQGFYKLVYVYGWYFRGYVRNVSSSLSSPVPAVMSAFEE